MRVNPPAARLRWKRRLQAMKRMRAKWARVPQRQSGLMYTGSWRHAQFARLDESCSP